MSKRKCVAPAKIAHRTKWEAIAHIAGLRRKDAAVRMSVYRCPAGHWHVGHRPPGRRKQW